MSSCVFITAAEARNNPLRDRAIHDEACGIQSAILDAIKLGYYEATVSDGTPMTMSATANIDVWTVDTVTDQLYIPNHLFKNGDTVTLNSTSTLPAPFKSNAYYYVIYVDDDHIKLADSYASAMAGRPIHIDVTAGVNSITITNHGTGYIQAPIVTFSGGSPTTSASARAYLASWGSVIGISNSTNGLAYNDTPTVQIVAQGSGATAGLVHYNVVGITVSNAGNDYHVGDILTVVGGTGTAATALVSEVDINGSIQSLIVSNSGDYTLLPILSNTATTVLPGGGTGATVNLTLGIKSIEIASGGVGYIAPPRITINDPSGLAAVASCVVTGGSVTSIVVSDPGYGYVGVTSVVFDSGSGATAIAALQPAAVSSIELTNNGGNTYVSVPTVSINSVGSGAAAGIVYMKVVSVQLASGGTGYSVNDTLLISGGSAISNAWIRVVSVDNTGRILTYTLEDGGEYSALPGLVSNPVNGGTGTLAGFNLTYGIASINVANTGSGYIVPPIVTVSAPPSGGVQAVVSAGIVSNVVINFVIDNPGSGYTAIPTVTVSNGSGATAEAVLSPTTLGNIIVTAGGSGYSSANVIISGGGASVDATAIANIAGDSVANIVITSSGVGYTSLPTITIIGDGTDAEASAELTPTEIASLTLLTQGSGYNTPPSVTISGAASAISRLSSTGIEKIIITNQGQNYTSDPFVYIIPGSNQTGTPVAPVMTVQRGYSVSSIGITSSGDGYQSSPSITMAAPQIYTGVQATATASIGAGLGTFILRPYYESRDYFKAWKNQTLSNNQLSRPYIERMDTVISYFTGLGYTINRLTNPATGNTFIWKIQW